MPSASPSDRLIKAMTGSMFEIRSMMLGERKAAQAKAPLWMYRFDWESPAFGGRLKSPHSMEVPFVFDTLPVIGEAHQKPGVRRSPTASRRPGRPSRARAIRPTTRCHPGRPTRPTRGTTMILDDDCKVAADPDGEARQLWTKVATA